MRHDGPCREFAVTIKVRTDRAILIYDHARDEEIWLPLSQVLEMHAKAGPFPKDATIVITDWIARQKGLIE